jgi:hypothetical protein
MAETKRRKPRGSRRMMQQEPQMLRKVVLVPHELWDQVREFRNRHFIQSDGETIRRLMTEALKAERRREKAKKTGEDTDDR